MCYMPHMTSIGLRELRQRASEIVRRVEEGEEIEITVATRPTARLVPITATPRRWRRWDQIAPLFETPVDAEWSSDQELIDQSVLNPWQRGDESSP